MSRCHGARSERHVCLFLAVVFGIWNGVVDVALRSLRHLPEPSVMRSYLLISQLRQCLTNLVGVKLYGRRKPRRYLRGSEILRLRLGAGVHVVGDDKLGGRVGSHEAAVMFVEVSDVGVVEPVTLAALDEGESLGTHALVGYVGSPGVVDAVDMERQPTAVSRLVGEEGEVVARGSERANFHLKRLQSDGNPFFLRMRNGRIMYADDLLSDILAVVNAEGKPATDKLKDIDSKLAAFTSSSEMRKAVSLIRRLNMYEKLFVHSVTHGGKPLTQIHDKELRAVIVLLGELEHSVQYLRHEVG